MLKKLGLWNRLALVAGAIGVVAFPTLTAWKQTKALVALQDRGYQACMADARIASSATETKFDYCWENWHERLNNGFPTFDDWAANAAFAAIVALLTYSIIWLAVATARWVWRGRRIGANGETSDLAIK